MSRGGAGHGWVGDKKWVVPAADGRASCRENRGRLVWLSLPLMVVRHAGKIGVGLLRR